MTLERVHPNALGMVSAVSADHIQVRYNFFFLPMNKSSQKGCSLFDWHVT